MADIALRSATATRPVEVYGSTDQRTGLAGESINRGQPVRFDTATGRLVRAAADTAPNARAVGIAMSSVKAGMGLTYLRRGLFEGFVLDALAYGADVFLSNTVGAIADAAGTVSTVLGHVHPGHAQQLGSNPDKLLDVHIRMAA